MIAPAEQPYVEWLDQVWSQKLSGDHHEGVRLTVGILLWPTFPMMSLTGIIESLRHAGDYGDHSRQRYVRWEIIGAVGRKVISSCGIEVTETCRYVDPTAFDYVFVIGGLLKDLGDVPLGHRRYIKVAQRAGCTLVGVCTGSFVLAEEKLLSGTPAAIHPYHKTDFELAFPGHRLTTSVDFVRSGKIATIPGGTSILSFMTDIIDSHFGPDRAAKTVHQLSLTGKRALTKLDRLGISKHLNISDPRVQKALVLIDANIEDTPSIPKLADQLGRSERPFLRLFKKEVGRSPQDYIVNARLNAAVWMLQNTTQSTTSIAYAAGFASGSSFSETCKRRLGKTPTQLRKRKAETIGQASAPRQGRGERSRWDTA